MTAFMERIAAMVGSDAGQATIPMPHTRISERIATSTGADRQVAIRSMAEQLVSEANAVLDRSDDQLALIDETLPRELAFRVIYRGRAVRVSTTFADGTAYGALVGDGFESELPQQLDGPEALPDLIIRLLMESDINHHPVTL